MLDRLAHLRERLAHGRDALRSTLGIGKANFLWDASSRETVLWHLLEWGHDAPDDRFLWWRGEWTTVGSFCARVETLAAAWHRLGVRKGDAVARWPKSGAHKVDALAR